MIRRLAHAAVVTGFVGTDVPDWLARRIDAGLGGVLYLDSAERRAWALGQVAVGDVWGVGRQYAHKLTAAGIDSAAELARVSEAWARKHLGGVVGARLVRELQGYPCSGGLAPSEDGTLRRQSISCSRTFGRPLREQAFVLGALAAFLLPDLGGAVALRAGPSAPVSFEELLVDGCAVAALLAGRFLRRRFRRPHLVRLVLAVAAVAWLPAGLYSDLRSGEEAIGMSAAWLHAGHPTDPRAARAAWQ